MTDVKTQAGKVLAQIAGYVGVRTLHVGLKSGLFRALAAAPAGLSAAALAERTGCDPFLVKVWCRSAYASEFLDLAEKRERESYDPARRRFTELDGQRFALGPHMDELLLDENSPGYLGAIPNVLMQPEVFEIFDSNLSSGGRTWWDRCSPAMIDAVSRTGWPFYVRLVPGGLAKVPGLVDVLNGPARVLELCCGAGKGLVRLAESFPGIRITGQDGDGHSLRLAQERVEKAGLSDRVALLHSPLEELAGTGTFDVALINISMHECRDIDRVAENVRGAIRPGGRFVISDFPFPARTEDCRTVPARVMCGIQFFEAMIDDQLLPTAAFEGLLAAHGFRDVGSFDLTPVHAVTYGTR